MLTLLKNLPKRIANAWRYSMDGLRAVFVKEESFRIECLAMVILAVVLLLSPWPAWKILALLGTYLLIPLAELLNSAVEDICDMVSPGHSPYVKAAKDKGSAAVLLAILVNALVLIALLLEGAAY